MNKGKTKYLTTNGLFIQFTHFEINKDLPDVIFLYKGDNMIGHCNRHSLRIDFISKTQNWVSYRLERDV